MAHLDGIFKEQRKPNCHYLEVESDYGHDAFLVEVEKFDTYVREALDE